MAAREAYWRRGSAGPYLGPADESSSARSSRRYVARRSNGLNAQAAAKVTIAITRIGKGHTANLKGVGGGVAEFKIDFGPGYGVYFGKDGDRLVILLGGGTKTRQKQDIQAALALWRPPATARRRSPAGKIRRRLNPARGPRYTNQRALPECLGSARCDWWAV